MKTSVKFMIVAIIATLSLVSCGEDEPEKMMWEVSATPTESVKATYDPGCYQQIQVVANANAGEATLVCKNYKDLVLEGIKVGNVGYEDSDCHFSATVVGNGTVKITFEKMPEGFNEISSYLIIYGIKGKYDRSTQVGIIRRP